MEKTHGTWGDRTRTFEWSGGIVTILELNPWQRCSYHVHRTSYNQFYVISGELRVVTEKGESNLRKGQSFTTEPGLYHEFQTTYEPAIVEEIAYVKYNEHDITRDRLGGPLKEQKENVDSS